MIKNIYSSVWGIIRKKPIALWGITLLSGLVSGLATMLTSGIAILGICAGILISVAMTMIFLRAYHGEKVESVQLFDLFKDFKEAKRVLAGMLWMYLWIFVWGLIPVVGPVFAVIRAYRYRLVPYILVTEPDVQPTAALKLSEERTRGYKAAMFLSDLIVYAAAFGAILVLVLFALIPYIGGFFLFLTIVAALAFIAVKPLVLGLIKTAFYDRITNAPEEEEPTAPVALPNPMAKEADEPISESAEEGDVYESAPLTTYTVEELSEETRVDDEATEPVTEASEEPVEEEAAIE